LSEITYFYDLAKPSAFGVPRKTLLYTRIENPKIHKTRIVPGKKEGIGSTVAG